MSDSPANRISPNAVLWKCRKRFGNDVLPPTSFLRLRTTRRGMRIPKNPRWHQPAAFKWLAKGNICKVYLR